MINKPFDAIQQPDLDALVSNSVREGRTVEYKEALPGGTDKDKKEFLADVSSFANTAGGDLIFGIEEERDEAGKPTGIPKRVVGLPNINADAEIRRLEDLIRTGIDPRLTGYCTRSIGSANSQVILIRIAKTWNAPHMVTLAGTSRFYGRTNTGKQPWDVGEIRSAFAMSETLPERIRRFREDRIARILAGEMPIPMNVGRPKTVLHILPISALDPSTRLDVSSLAQHGMQAQPLYATGGYDSRYNLDGYATFKGGDGTCWTYTQIFRNGAIEAVTDQLIISGKDGGIPSTEFEQQIVEKLPQYIKIEELLGLQPPLFVMLTLLGVKGYSILLPQSDRYFARDSHTKGIDRDILPLPDVLADTYDLDAGKFLKPIFDAVWQAAGWAQSRNYNKNGDWSPQSYY